MLKDVRKVGRILEENRDVKRCPECANPLYANVYDYRNKKYVCGKCGHEEVVRW